MVALFILSWIIMLFFAVRLIAQGWSSASDLRIGNYVESSRTVTKPPHPEMADVAAGDELLVINFTPDEEFTRRIKESDNFLQQSLQDRIDEIEDEDDDGDVLVTRP